MRASFIVPMFAAFVAASVLSAPAGATTVKQAERLCEKNPNCTKMGCTRKGACTFCVNQCEHAVSCPPKGPCIVNYIRPQAQKVRGEAGTVLTSGGNKPGVGGPRVSREPGGSPKVVRDHRIGANGGNRPQAMRAEARPHR